MLTLTLACFLAGPPVPEPLPPGAIARLGVGGPFGQWIADRASFSLDGRRVAVTTSKGLQVWDATTREALTPWKNLPRHAAAFGRFTPDGKHVVCNFNGVWCFETETAKLLWRTSDDLGPFAASNTWIADARRNGKRIIIRDLASGKEHRQIPFPEAGSCQFAIAPDESRHELIVLTPGNELLSFDVRDGKERWKQLLQRPWEPHGRHLVYDPRGKWIATAGPERLVRLFTPDGKPGRVLAMDQGEIWGLSFDSLGRLAVLFADRVTIYEADTGRVVHQQPLPGLYLYVTLSNTGEFWVQGNDRRLESYHIGHVRQAAPKGHLSKVEDIVPHPSGGWVTLGAHNEIIVWGAAGQFLQRLRVKPAVRQGDPHVSHLLPSGKGWIQGNGRRGILYEEINESDRRLNRIVASHAPNRAIPSSICFASNDRFRIIWSYPNFLQRLEGSTSKGVWRRGLPSGEQAIFGTQQFELSPDDSKLLLSSYNSTGDWRGFSLYILDTSDGKVLARTRTSSPYGSYAIFLDNETVLFSSQVEERRQIWKWEFASGRRELVSEQVADPVQRMTRSRDGRWFVVTSLDRQQNSIRELYETRTLRPETRWSCNQNPSTFSWSLDNRLLATGGREGLIYLWDATGGAKPSANAEADWQRLREPAGHDAAWRLALTPGVESLLARKLRPMPPLDPNQWATLLDDLDSDDFATRLAAQKSLDALGTTAIASARRSLASDKRLEIRRRLERYLAAQPQTPDGLQQHRAIFVLEQHKARALLYRLAEGDPEADLTREAKAALTRMTREK